MRVRHNAAGKEYSREQRWLLQALFLVLPTAVVVLLLINRTTTSQPLQQQGERQLSLSNDVSSSSSFTTKAAAPAIRGGGASSTGGGVVVGSTGGAWTAETHLTQYGFNVDAGLVRVLESSCRDIENARNTPDSQWSPHPSQDASIGGFWRAPAVVDCQVLELGSGVGVYVDALKKDQGKKNRKVFGIEPNRMGGVYERRNGPRQLLVDIMADNADPVALAQSVLRDELHNANGGFDLIYSIEVCEHMPLDRHIDAAKFLAALARPGTKLIFGAASPGQSGTGHMGNRSRAQWEEILAQVGFVKHDQETLTVAHELDEYNHKVNTQVYYFNKKP
jgi:SAM-dependent methyltransferase